MAGLNAAHRGPHTLPVAVGRKSTAARPSTSTGSATTWPSGPTGSAAATAPLAQLDGPQQAFTATVLPREYN